MSIKNIAKKITLLERKRLMVLEKILSVDFMIRGSFSQTKRKCGKPNCWCKNGSGHPNTRITWNEGSQSKTKSILEKDVPWIKEATASYKGFRKLRHEIKVHDNEMNNLLNLFEKTLIHTTKKNKKIDW